LVVFVSLVLWGWVLGPVGMLLSIPLTIMLKIALESQSETRWIGVMLGAGGVLDTVAKVPQEPQLAAPKDSKG